MTVDEFIAEWKPSGGNERANTQTFINDLCKLLGVQRPRASQEDPAANDYVFERHVIKTEIDGSTSSGWIDCYKRDCFILEAKQGSTADAAAVDNGEGDALRDFFGQTAETRFKRGMAKRGTGQWTGAMQKAAGQAEGYAKALPREHGWPPFLLVCDVGYCLDVYADFSRSGKSYAPFPDRRRFRITIDDLENEKVRERLRIIWEDPLSLDPSAEAARVTRQVAQHLALLACRLEAREQNPDRVASFLMRLLFTMFAEDTGLIPRESFTTLLRKVRERPENLVPQLTDLWAKMDSGGFVGALGEAGETVRQFNGYLFKETTALQLEAEEIAILISAAASDWQQVEPAIFGTLLERALSPRDRAKLGAHYTPRAYVERLVQPTIMDPLHEDWLGARTAATEAAESGDKERARKIVEEFHRRLARTRILDPACGTGNFLYVALARMKELEGEVLELLGELGDSSYLSDICAHTITPENFLGIEINPRAAAIAQLVLWIGYLQWHFRVNGSDRMPPPPVLRDVRTIQCRDALIEWDSLALERDRAGRPLSRWDGETMKKHPTTGRNVPDETSRAEIYRIVAPRKSKWPKADFIIGNPPFIGNKRMRRRLGDAYCRALFKVSSIPESADYVMYWWDRGALAVRKGQARRFGFITTNSLHQTFGRSVIKTHMEALDPLALTFAIPDHPWIDETGSAAVRVAMTAGQRGPATGKLLQLRSDHFPTGEELFDERVGTIQPNLQVGTSLLSTRPLKANRRLASLGSTLVGGSFLLTQEEAKQLTEVEPAAGETIRPYISGRDMSGQNRELRVIDLFGRKESEVKSQFPYLYNRLRTTVWPARAQNKRQSYRISWWVHAEPRPEIRRALADIDRYIVTPRTAKHRIFMFVDSEVLAEARLVAIALSDAWSLGVLSSRYHAAWSLAWGARQGVGNDINYNISECFGTFPFPRTDNGSLKTRVRDAAEKLDALRKNVIARNPDLTLTKLYNTFESLRAADAAGTALDGKERYIAERGCVSLIREYHDDIDAAVAECYGWPSDLQDEEIIERLIALNTERAAEEAGGQVRWLRKEFQAPHHVAGATAAPVEHRPGPEKSTAQIIEWPRNLPDQIVAVAGVVDGAGRPIRPEDVAKAFKGKRVSTVRPVLDAIAGMGRLRKLGDGRYAA